MPGKHIVDIKSVMLHTLLFIMDKTAATFAMCTLISASRDKLFVIIEPRYVN